MALDTHRYSDVTAVITGRGDCLKAGRVFQSVLCFLDVISGKSPPALTLISCLFWALGAVSAERYTSETSNDQRRLNRVQYVQCVDTQLVLQEDQLF